MHHDTLVVVMKRSISYLLTATIVVGSAQGCHEPSSAGNPDGGDAGLDSRAPEDAGTEAGLNDGGQSDGTVHDYCALPFFKLPIDGWSEEILGGAHLNEGRVVYAKGPWSHMEQREVYLFDLPNCAEYTLTYGAWADWSEDL